LSNLLVVASAKLSWEGCQKLCSGACKSCPAYFLMPVSWSY